MIMRKLVVLYVKNLIQDMKLSCNCPLYDVIRFQTVLLATSGETSSDVNGCCCSLTCGLLI